MAGINAFIAETKSSIEESLPEWHLKQVRGQTAPSGYSVALQLIEFQLKIGRMRRAATAALSELHCMALVAQNVASSMDVAREIEQEYDMGDLLPNDEAAAAGLAYSDLANKLITRGEALIRRGYSKDESLAMLKSVDEEADERASRATAFFDTPPAEDEDEPQQGETNGAPANALGALQPNS